MIPFLSINPTLLTISGDSSFCKNLPMVLTLIAATITPLNVSVLLLLLLSILSWLSIIGKDIYNLGMLSVDSTTLLKYGACVFFGMTTYSLKLRSTLSFFCDGVCFLLLHM